ncbi:hypothetical protein ES704_00640 [subsurface metagenome]|jgi:hypothetical protein
MSRIVKRFNLTIPILISIVFFFISFVMAEETFEINTFLMRSTFKIIGENSIGTVFILGKPCKENPDKAYYVLITATHVLANMKGDKATLFLRKKFNNLYEKLPWEISIRKEGKNLWINHPEVDVSAMYIALPIDIDIALLPIGILADDETFNKFEIHPGDELLCLGYPFSAEANKAGFPILRSGKIASFPIVPAKETKSFLFDFEVFKGNSGGPVYFVQSTARAYGGATHIGTIQFIAGLVSEEHIITEEITSLYEKQMKVYPLALAKVIHASFIKETIEMLPSID